LVLFAFVCFSLYNIPYRNPEKIISAIFSIAFGGFGDFLLIQYFLSHPEYMPLPAFILILVCLTGSAGWLFYYSIKSLWLSFLIFFYFSFRTLWQNTALN